MLKGKKKALNSNYCFINETSRASDEYIHMFKNKRMAETPEIAQYAVESGVVESVEDVTVLEDNINRICAPDGQDRQRMWSIILWTKDSENDNSPQPNKIVGLHFGESN